MTDRPDYEALAADIPDDYPLEQTAQHEAGHACANWALSLPFRFVTIRRTPIPRVEPVPGHQTHTFPAILRATAGAIAEMQLTGWHIAAAGLLQLLYGSPDGTFTLTHAAGRVRSPDRPVRPGQDLHYLTRRIAEVDLPRHEAVAMYRDCERFTGSLRPAIDAVAAQLLKRGQLDSRQVAKLASAAMAGRAPWIPQWADPKASNDALIAEAERSLIEAGLSVEAERQLLAAHDATAGRYPYKCHHEAGHAVTLAILRMPFTESNVTLPMPCTLLPAHMAGWPSTGAEASGRLIVRAAGGIADLEARGLGLPDEAIVQLIRGPGPLYDVHDKATGQTVIRPWRLPAVASGRDLDLWSEFTKGWPAAALVDAYRAVERFVVSVMPAVTAVAAALDTRGVLTSRQVGEITTQALAGQPHPPIPEWAAELVPDAVSPMYALSERAGAKQAIDASGNNAPPLTEYVYTGLSGSGSVTFGSPGAIGTGAAGFTTSVINGLLCSPAAAGFANGNTQLEGNLATPLPASAGFTFDITANASAFVNLTACGVADTAARIGLMVQFQNPTGWNIGTRTPTAGSVFSSTTAGPPNAHLDVTVSGTTATLWVNGVSGATLTIPSGFTARRVFVGGPYLGGATANIWSGFAGTLNCFAVYPSVLSSARIAAHYTAAILQNQGQMINTLIINTLNYAGIPSAFYSVPATGGVSYADAYDATGQNPLAMLQ